MPDRWCRRATVEPVADRPKPVGYHAEMSEALATRLAELAELCRLGRHNFHVASGVDGFRPIPGTESEVADQATLQADWPYGPWPGDGPALQMHQVGLMVSNSAAGRLGELAALLEAGEVMFSLPTHSRGVMEQCARLFRIYTQPYLPHIGTYPMPPAATKAMFAAAHLEMFDGVFSALKLAQLYLDADPTDADRQAEVTHVTAELNRMQGAFTPLYDAATTDLTNPNKLKIEGAELQKMTPLVNEIAEWIWPDPAKRPKSMYKDFSGHAHGSLDADIELWEIVDSDSRRDLIRKLPRDFVETNVLTALALFHRAFARLVGFYGWDEEPLNEFGDSIVAAFPGRFTYNP